MTTLIAGGAGFIGSNLCSMLLEQGQDVICVDNFVTGRMANVAPLMAHPGFTLLQHDVSEPLPSLPPLTAIYHLASPASPPAYQRYPLATLRVNSEGTRHLLEVAADHGARFLFASTSEIYGDPTEHPQRETYRGNVSPIGPRSMYDEAKRYGEALTTAFGEATGIETRIVRIFNTYGPRLNPEDGRVISNFVVQALRGEPLTIYGDGSQTRSFQYVDDLLDGIIRLMGSSWRGPVNLGNPEEFTMLQLAELVRDLTNSGSEIGFCPLPVDDPRQRRPDISIARSVLGWRPRVPLCEGLLHTIAYLEAELSRNTTAVAVPAA